MLNLHLGNPFALPDQIDVRISISRTAEAKVQSEVAAPSKLCKRVSASRKNDAWNASHLARLLASTAEIGLTAG